MASKSSIKRLKFCNFKLSSLLEITNAINLNLSINELLEKYSELLINELRIGKILVFAYSETWQMMLEYGVEKNEIDKINIPDDFLKYEEITLTSSSESVELSVFDFIIPVFHDTNPIAYVLIGDVEEEQEGVSPTIKHLHFIQTLTNVIFVAIENKRLYNESLKQERIKKEMELASKMQSMLVPDSENFPQNEYLQVKSFYLPHFDVGGDYYDFEQLSENEFFFCIADVSGKGMSAALLMANFQASTKGYLHAGLSLPNLIEKLNQRVIKNAQGEKFITFFVGKYNYQTRILKYVNAGHNPPFLIDNYTRKLQILSNGCPGVGMLDEIPFIKEGEILIKNPSKLISFTDGLTELENGNHEEIGLAEIEKAIKMPGDIETTINSLKNSLYLEKSNPFLFDDITILGIDFL